MKKFTTLQLIAVACAVTALTMSVRAQIPSDISDFKSHGIHVILRQSKANEVIGVYLGIEGGLAYHETENPVLAGMSAGLIPESGSDKYPKEVYRDTLAKLSTTIGGGGSIYSMNFTMRTITPSFPAAWDIFSDLLLHPHFDQTEFTKSTQTTINGIKSRSSNPDGYTNFINDSLWFGASPLNRRSQVSDVQGLTTNQLADFYHNEMQRSRMLLVIVGNVSRAEIEKALSSWEAIPEGSFTWPAVDRIAPPENSSATLIPRKIVTTYFLARCAAPNIGSKDWWSERILYEILNKRLFNEVRTKRNLSYSPGGYVGGTHGSMYGLLTFQSVLPDSAEAVVMNEVKKLQTDLVPKEELENAKAGRITTFFYVMQKNLEQARNLYSNQVESGDWRNLFRVTTETPKVTAEDVRSVAQKYMHHFLFTLLGPDTATATVQPATKSKYQFD